MSCMLVWSFLLPTALGLGMLCTDKAGQNSHRPYEFGLSQIPYFFPVFSVYFNAFTLQFSDVCKMNTLKFKKVFLMRFG